MKLTKPASIAFQIIGGVLLIAAIAGFSNGAGFGAFVALVLGGGILYLGGKSARSKIRTIAVLLFTCGLFVTGCSTQQVSTPASTNLWQVNESIQVKVAGQVQDADLLQRLTKEIKSQLILAGFDIEKQSDKKLLLNVNVSQYNPGNNALRLTVGFGAGRGSLIYSAEYIDPDGKVLARMDGQERFTGQEVGFNTNYGVLTTLGGEDTVRAVLLKEAGRHIVELAVKPEAAR